MTTISPSINGIMTKFVVWKARENTKGFSIVRQLHVSQKCVYQFFTHEIELPAKQFSIRYEETSHEIANFEYK